MLSCDHTVASRAPFRICAAMRFRAFALVGARCSFRPVFSMNERSAERTASGVSPSRTRTKRAIMPLVITESESAM